MSPLDLRCAEADASDDASIVRRILGGDRAAFALLMRRHNQRLYRLARAVLRDATEAEDALQDAYLHAYRSLDQFRGDARLSTWLSRLVLNECLARRRRDSRRHKVVPIVSDGAGTDIGAVAAEEQAQPDRSVARAQIRRLLERRLEELPESFRAIFILRSVEELSVAETAQCLGIPEATVRSGHFRARSLLRDALAQEFDLVERDLFEFAGSRCDGIIARVLARL